MCDITGWIIFASGLVLGLFVCLMIGVMSHVNRPQPDDVDEHEKLAE